MTSHAANITNDLQDHLALCEELLLLVERENQLLRNEGVFPAKEFYQCRKQLLPLLDGSLSKIKAHRVERQKQSSSRESHQPSSAIAARIRLVQDMIMKILTIDRENEQILLRRGMMPAQRLPGINRQRPHFVADLYRRHSSL